MRKVGAIALIIVGAVLILIAVLRLLSVLLIFFSADASAYGLGFLIGTAFVVILLILLGQKSIKKGRSLLKPESSAEIKQEELS